MPINSDYSDMLSALNDAGAEYLIVGAYAMAAHGVPRATGDIDFWIRPTPENAERVWQALSDFGASRSQVTVADFAAPDTIFQIGVPPRRIDILTSISGVDFDSAWHDRLRSTLSGHEVSYLGRPQMIINKRASGRPKDLLDLAYLESVGDNPQNP